MKLKVDKDACISCGLCMNEAPEVYSWDEDEKAKAINGQVPSDLEEGAMAGIEGCPTDAIIEE